MPSSLDTLIRILDSLDAAYQPRDLTPPENGGLHRPQRWNPPKSVVDRLREDELRAADPVEIIVKELQKSERR